LLPEQPASPPMQTSPAQSTNASKDIFCQRFNMLRRRRAKIPAIEAGNQSIIAAKVLEVARFSRDAFAVTEVIVTAMVCVLFVPVNTRVDGVKAQVTPAGRPVPQLAVSVPV